MEKKKQYSPDRTDSEPGYNPRFEWRFFAPRFWPMWLMLSLLMVGRIVPRTLWGLVGAGVAVRAIQL